MAGLRMDDGELANQCAILGRHNEQVNLAAFE
jgi:hypothetical protein